MSNFYFEDTSLNKKKENEKKVGILFYLPSFFLFLLL